MSCDIDETDRNRFFNTQWNSQVASVWAFFFSPLDVGTIVPGKWGGGNVYVVHHFSKSSSLYV